jgi:hypothetical protein
VVSDKHGGGHPPYWYPIANGMRKKGVAENQPEGRGWEKEKFPNLLNLPLAWIGSAGGERGGNQEV